MEEFCQNKFTKKLYQKDPILFEKIMNYQRQTEDTKQVQKFIIDLRQSSLNIIRKIQLQKQLEEEQYKFPIKKGQYNKKLNQMQRNEQIDPQYQNLKCKRYNLYEQNLEKQLNSNGKFFSEANSKNDSFQQQQKLIESISQKNKQKQNYSFYNMTSNSSNHKKLSNFHQSKIKVCKQIFTDEFNRNYRSQFTRSLNSRQDSAYKRTKIQSCKKDENSIIEKTVTGISVNSQYPNKSKFHLLNKKSGANKQQ